jgi:hypothetical protein
MLGPVLIFLETSVQVSGEDALYVEMVCKDPPFAGNMPDKLASGVTPNCACLEESPSCHKTPERRQVTCARDPRLAWSRKVDQPPFFVRDNLTQRTGRKP